jgi:hypothetical protein
VMRTCDGGFPEASATVGEIVNAIDKLAFL